MSKGKIHYTGNYYLLIAYRFFLAFIFFWFIRLFFYFFNISDDGVFDDHRNPRRISTEADKYHHCLLNYRQPFFAFGNNIFNEQKPHFVVNYFNGIYQIADAQYLLQYEDNKTIALFDYKKDKLLQRNLSDSKPAIKATLEKTLRAFIQQYNNCMIENRLTVE